MNSTARLLPLALAALLFSAPSSAGAAPAPLLRETFDSGISSVWRTVNGVHGLAHESSEPPSGLDGNALRHSRTSRAGTDGLHCARLPPTTLAPGASLTMSFDFSGVNYTRNSGNYLVFGFLQGSGRSPSSPDGATGYAAALRMDARSGLRGRLHTFRTLDLVVPPRGESSAGDEAKEVQRGDFPFYLHDDNISDRFRFTLTVTRLAEGDLRLDALFLNATRRRSFGVVRTVPAADLPRGGGEAAYAFDGIAIGFKRAGSEDSVFDIDNVEVTRSAGR